MKDERVSGTTAGRTIAMTGALVLWGAAALLVLPDTGNGWSPALAKTVEPAVDIPAPTRILFRFQPGSERLPLGYGAYSPSAVEQGNFLALDHVLRLVDRVSRLPVQWVWVGTEGLEGLSQRRALAVQALLAERARSRGQPFPAAPWPVQKAAGKAIPGDGEPLELRLLPVRPQAACDTLTEVLDPSLPPGGDKATVPVSLLLAGGQVRVDQDSVWRLVPGDGKAGRPGPWQRLGEHRRTWTAEAGMGKDFDDDVRRWGGGSLRRPPVPCGVELVVEP
ncbi:hypothetical protein J2847_003327 [Azospirillum agricola]|uniref:hypothetical protein n=1 Tax=Azospirillum agricola TaxID=1720247 RepID=UPI001AE8FEA8|nr:hypothetical protein [Azospirillum agricola]MBP2230024.1 hypothetical protein [Azospirillum agricola]